MQIMANSIEFVAGNGIAIELNESSRSIKITSNELTANQKAALNNPSVSSTNKFISASEVDVKIQTAIQNGGATPGLAPEGFPKFFTSSTNYTIPKTGRYKISMVGGGAGGMALDGGHTGNAGSGGSTSVTIKGASYSATGGASNKPKSSIPYDGKQGACSGGNKGERGEDGAGQGGVPYNTYSGGGGGSPLNFNIDQISGGIVSAGVSKGYPNPNCSGKGYGAGGGGYGTQDRNDAAGGCSGYLVIKELTIEESTPITIKIGGGGAAGEVRHTGGDYIAGSGAQGAVLLEWIGS